MSAAQTAVALGVMLVLLVYVLNRLIHAICEAFREGRRCEGFLMTGMIAVIVVAALPWYLM